MGPKERSDDETTAVWRGTRVCTLDGVPRCGSEEHLERSLYDPHLWDYVTFSATYPKTPDHYGVRIQVLCYQDGNLVYGEAGPYSQQFLLGGAMSNWFLSGGASSCHADLYYWSYNGGQKFNPLASTNFDASDR